MSTKASTSLSAFLYSLTSLLFPDMFPTLPFFSLPLRYALPHRSFFCLRLLIFLLLSFCFLLFLPFIQSVPSFTLSSLRLSISSSLLLFYFHSFVFFSFFYFLPSPSFLQYVLSLPLFSLFTCFPFQFPLIFFLPFFLYILSFPSTCSFLYSFSPSLRPVFSFVAPSSASSLFFSLFLFFLSSDSFPLLI